MDRGNEQILREDEGFSPVAEEWVDLAYEAVRSRFGRVATVLSSLCILRNVYEDLVAEGNTTPYRVATRLFDDQIVLLKSVARAVAVMKPDLEEPRPFPNPKNGEQVEQFHTELFDLLFSPYGPEALEKTMARLETRLAANGLDGDYFAGKRCVDLGCGGGRFLFVMAKLNAAETVGVDLGRQSLISARENAERLVD